MNTGEEFTITMWFLLCTALEKLSASTLSRYGHLAGSNKQEGTQPPFSARRCMLFYEYRSFPPSYFAFSLYPSTASTPCVTTFVLACSCLGTMPLHPFHLTLPRTQEHILFPFPSFWFTRFSHLRLTLAFQGSVSVGPYSSKWYFILSGPQTSPLKEMGSLIMCPYPKKERLKS